MHDRERYVWGIISYSPETGDGGILDKYAGFDHVTGQLTWLMGSYHISQVARWPSREAAEIHARKASPHVPGGTVRVMPLAPLPEHVWREAYGA